jgi:hypothetical protein
MSPIELLTTLSDEYRDWIDGDEYPVRLGKIGHPPETLDKAWLRVEFTNVAQTSSDAFLIKVTRI